MTTTQMVTPTAIKINKNPGLQPKSLGQAIYLSQASPPLSIRSSEFVPTGSQERYTLQIMETMVLNLDTCFLKTCSMHF